MARATTQIPDPRRSRLPRRRRSRSFFLLVTIVVLGLLWIVYWYGAREIAAATLERATAAAGERGYAVECTNQGSGGFPLSLDISCDRVSLLGQTNRLSAVVDGLAAKAPLYWPGRVEWNATGPLVLDAPLDDLGLTATWREARATVDGGLGGLSGGTARFADLRIHLPSERASLPYRSVAAATTSVAVAPGPGQDYRISASADAITLESDDDRALPEIDVEAELAALAFGNALGLDPREALRAWMERGGSLRIDKLTMAAGDVSTSCSGTLTLSPAGNLSGQLKVAIAGMERLPDLVEAFHPGSRERVAQITAAAIAFTRPTSGPNGPTREMSLLIRDSVVSIGIIPIGVIPPLVF